MVDILFADRRRVHPPAAALIRATAGADDPAMAQDVSIGPGRAGKVRSFWAGLGLSIVTLGVYSCVWYYRLNEELQAIGEIAGDAELAETRPARSVWAIVIGSFLLVPLLVSMYRFGERIRRAQRIGRVADEEQFNPGLAFAALVTGLLLLVPLFFYYWYVTRHQNRALRASAGLVPAGGVAVAGSLA
jgi:Domain of unknown function (DUF4234)